MDNEIKVEDVVYQFTKAVRLFLKWEEQRIIELSKPREESKTTSTLEEGRLLRISEAANRLKISKSLMYRMVQQGQIPSIRIGKSVRIHERDLTQFIEMQNG